MSALPVVEFDALCVGRWPAIPWLEPIHVQRPNDDGWACRLCVARNGLKGTDPLFATLEEALAHVEEAHMPGTGE